MPATAPIQLSFTLPTSPDTKVLLHLTNHAHSLILFVTTTSSVHPSTAASLGSLVYALPNVRLPESYPGRLLKPPLLLAHWKMPYLC